MLFVVNTYTGMFLHKSQIPLQTLIRITVATTANGEYQVKISEIRALKSHYTLTGCASKKNLTGNVFSFICLYIPYSLYRP